MPHFLKKKIPGQEMLGDQKYHRCFPTCISVEPWEGAGITAKVGGLEGGQGELLPLDMMAMPNLGDSSELGMDHKKRTLQ